MARIINEIQEKVVIQHKGNGKKKKKSRIWKMTQLYEDRTEQKFWN